MASCPPVRLQLHMEFAPTNVDGFADNVMQVVSQAGEVFAQFSGADPNDASQTDLEWGSLAWDSPPWRGNRRHRRSTDLARFEQSIRRGRDAGGSLEWSAMTSERKPVGMVVDFESRNERPQAVVTALWDASEPLKYAPHAESLMLGLAADTVAKFRPAFLHLTDDMSITGRTALELALPRSVTVTPGDLRSYSWVTLLSNAQIERCGGPDTLQASRAFHALLPTNNGYLAQATKHLSAYVGTRIRQVRDALRPVLPTRPLLGGNTDGQRLAWDDCSTGPTETPPGRTMGAIGSYPEV
jgi:hypothetical protein